MFHVKHPIEFERILRTQGVSLTQTQIEKLECFVESVLEWNSKINLLSRKDAENIWYSHILHSLTLLMYIDWQPGWRVIDLGTGGGFPGAPLAIVRDDLQFTLVDSIQKKITALQNIMERVNVANVSVIASRGEDLAKQGGHQRAYDVVIARAVASLSDLVKWSKPFLRRKTSVSAQSQPTRVGGKFSIDRPALVAMKGGDLGDEIRTAKIKHRIETIKSIDIIFEGSVEIGLEEKKLLIVPF